MKTLAHAMSMGKGKYRKAVVCLLIVSSWALLCPLFAKADCSYSAGDYFALPPFLGGSVKANLLLMLDNSGSMYDLAYVDDQSYCYDDTYTAANFYAGYFDRDYWYYYNQANGQFEQRTQDWVTTATAAEWTSPAGTQYHRLFSIHIKVDGDTVTAFFAKGNFLNWATASKLDIQKKILTGGKYEATGTYGAPNGRIVMESRGCLGRPLVKQVDVYDNAGTLHHLTLGVRPPEEETFPVWTNNTAYPAGSVVTDNLELFVTAAGGTSNGTGVADDTGVTDWVPYTLSRWTDGAWYPANSVVRDGGDMYITATGGTANGTGVADDIGITDWVSYNVTHIEVFPVTQDGFDHGDCELAIEELQKDSPNQGALKQYIDGCMGYEAGGGQTKEADSHAAFNHGIHNCWYMAKHGIWPPGAGPVNSVASSCEHIYVDWATNPWDITVDDRGYVCFGLYDDAPGTAPDPNPFGYVGRCWSPGEGATCTCTQWWNPNKCLPHVQPDPECCKKWECSGGLTPPGWDAAGYASVDACIEAALQDYCGLLEIPEVIDPSDQAGETGEFWNIPAVLIDSGMAAQQGEPLAVFKGYIQHDNPPTGLLHEFSEDLRIGAMIFNDYGSKSECDQPDPQILYNCSDPENRDGGKIVAYIDEGEAHTDDLVSAINDIKATCWTPLAESMYTALGYYTQNSALKLDPDDFIMDVDHPDPVQYWCQGNNLLIITEGASTADGNATVAAFVAQANQNDGDGGDSNDCGSLDGTTSLDDLTYFANNGDIYPIGNKQMDGVDKQKITTHIVAAGSLRATGSSDECSPDILLASAAQNGGTSLYNPADPGDLEDTLRRVFSNIRAGAAAGSAASVISASRAGEGAIYQAIFFPVVYDLSGDAVNWFGEVHALFVDGHGNMREDTNGNAMLDVGTDRIIEFDGNTALATLYTYDPNTGQKTLSAQDIGIMDLNYIWESTSWLSDPNMDVLTQRTYASVDQKRYIFTNNIDTSSPVSLANVYGGDVMAFTTDFVNDLANDNYFFLNPYLTYDSDGDPGTPHVALTEAEMITEAQKIIQFTRGQEGLSETGSNVPYRNRTLDMDDNGTADTVLRLGDIVHSTPTVVSQPVEAYDMLYRDRSYQVYRKQYLGRRIVVYAGANDGMLHAFNGGFYDKANYAFVKQMDGETPFDLGAELWAYVPNALLPHLKWLKELTGSNTHVYFVDLKPRIFDAKIFPADSDHPEGWGTVLVGGMRLGGAPIGVDVDGDGLCDLGFTSTYFALDITNPEHPPDLLWSFTDHNLGFTTTNPTPIRVGNEWFVVIGSGPVDYDATRKDDGVHMTNWGGSNRTSSLYILDANTGSLEREFLLDGHSFASDPIAVDLDLATDPPDPGPADAVSWSGEAIYVGTDGCGA